MSKVMELTEQQQNNLPDWAIYGHDNQGGVVVVDGDRAFTEILNALDLPANQDTAEAARKWATEIIQRRLFTYGLAKGGELIQTGLTYEQMAAWRSEQPGTSKVLEGYLRVRFVGDVYRLITLPKAKTRHADNWRRLTPLVAAAGLI
jgi:hypothetical protein